MNKLSASFNKNKQWLFYSLMATFLWGLLAHGYGFLQNSFSHDALNEFCGEVFGNHIKYMSGRFLSPIYRAIFRTSLTLPWLIGILSLVWIGLSVFLVGRIFKIESKTINFLVAGIFTVNITVSAISATYMHDLDSDMMALLFAVAAVYLWQRYRAGWLAGALLITISLSLYQAYITVTITLVMFVCILALINEETFQSVFCRGVKAIGMLLLGGLFYCVVIKSVLFFSDITLLSGGSNGLDKMLELDWKWALTLAYEAYIDCYTRLVNMVSPYPGGMVKGATYFLFALTGLVILVNLCSKRISVQAKILCLALVCLLPLGMNIIYILSTGVVHDLMIFSVWLFYLLALLLTDWLAKYLKKTPMQFQKIRAVLSSSKCVCMLLVFMLMYGNVQTANGLYLKKDQEQDAYLSMMTRVVYKMEDYDQYIPGKTPVVFVGISSQMGKAIPGFEKYHNITGAWSTDVLNSAERSRYMAYFDYVLNNPVVLVAEPLWSEWQKDARVESMPCYPTEGCMAMIEDIMVVKLGNT